MATPEQTRRRSVMRRQRSRLDRHQFLGHPGVTINRVAKLLTTVMGARRDALQKYKDCRSESRQGLCDARDILNAARSSEHFRLRHPAACGIIGFCPTGPV
jgi:hypothetical protein